MIRGEVTELSRRLKKKIRDLCGLDGLSKEARLLRAKEVLENTNTKQKLCNLVQGLTFKDIEKAMRDVLAERLPTEQEQEELELRELAPDKFEPEIPELFKPKAQPTKFTRTKEYGTYSPEHVAWLIEQGNKSPEPSITEDNRLDYKTYNTYTLEDVQALMRGDYQPSDVKKRWS